MTWGFFLRSIRKRGPGRLVRLFRPIIPILFSTVDRIGHQLPARDWITSQLVRDVESVTGSTMSTFQSSGIERAELDTPQTDCCAADGNTSLGEESVTFISIHPPTLPIWPS